MKATALKPAAIGSISHGTLRPEDLIPCFLSELESLLDQTLQGAIESNTYEDWKETLKGIAAIEKRSGFDSYYEEDHADVDSDLEWLMNRLSEYAPPYCYFGAHEGDGSDFGYWPSSMEIDELPTVENSDAARELGEDCKVVTDHGNVTVYGGDGSVLLKLV